jgi:hypothetical protein
MKVFVVIEMEVSDSSAPLLESQARQIAFDEISSKVLTQKKTGRPASGPKASVSGITVESDEDYISRTDRTVLTAQTTLEG